MSYINIVNFTLLFQNFRYNKIKNINKENINERYDYSACFKICY